MRDNWWRSLYGGWGREVNALPRSVQNRSINLLQRKKEWIRWGKQLGKVEGPYIQWTTIKNSKLPFPINTFYFTFSVTFSFLTGIVYGICILFFYSCFEVKFTLIPWCYFVGMLHFGIVGRHIAAKYLIFGNINPYANCSFFSDTCSKVISSFHLSSNMS